MMMKTVQILVAIIIIALATVGALWVLDLIDAAQAQATLYRLGGFIAICAVAAFALLAVFSLGGSGDDSA